VPSQEPELAAREIERVADHAGFVQVLLPIRSELPYGKRHHRPIFEAAAERDLVVCLHFGGSPPAPPTASGWPSFYVEQYAGMAAIAQTQLTSLIAEGVYEELPELRVTVAEAGFAWVPEWLWRFDKDWQMLRREIPWTKLSPAEYVARQVRFTVRPIDGPHDPELLARIVEETEPVHLGSLLMYSSDFPHEHGDEDDLAFLDHVSAETREKILAGTAEGWYRFGRGGR
jgi:predicted TIM-barrel fold metal-dependent hydrolase